MNNILQIIRLAVCLALTLGSAAAWPQAAGYPFTVTVQGDGTVQINLTEPACVGAPGASVTCVFEAGGTDKVTLTASANSASSVFTGWSGANFCTGIEVCRFSISGPGLALTAAFQSALTSPRFSIARSSPTVCFTMFPDFFLMASGYSGTTLSFIL